MWGVSVNPSPRPKAVSSVATTAIPASLGADAHLVWASRTCPRLTSPHLTFRAPRLHLQSLSVTFQRYTSAQAHAHTPSPRGPSAGSGMALVGRAGCFCSQCGHRRLGEGDRRGRGKGWEWVSARRPSVVVSWLRAAVAESQQL